MRWIIWLYGPKAKNKGSYLGNKEPVLPLICLIKFNMENFFLPAPLIIPTTRELLGSAFISGTPAMNC